jgi:hypothetical protein
VVVLDAGGAFMPLQRGPAKPLDRAIADQWKLKGELIAEAWKLGGIDAVGLGDSDWELGLDFFKGLAADHDVPFLAANLICDGASPFPGHRVIDVEGRRIGVVGLTSGEVAGCEVTSAPDAMRGSVEAMGAVDVLLALAPFSTPVDLAGAFPDDVPVHLIFDGRGGHASVRNERFGQGWSVSAGSRGKQVGTVRLEWNEGAVAWGPAGGDAQIGLNKTRAEQRLESVQSRLNDEHDPVRKNRWQQQITAYETQIADMEEQLAKAAAGGGVVHAFTLAAVPLNPQLPDHPATRQLVDTAKTKMSDVGPSPGKHPAPAHRAPAGSPYAGADACAACHPTEHAQWLGTKHASALASLVEDKRHMDDTCWGCHVTGARKEGGPQRAVEVRGMKDVQCEACHGASAAHVKAPADVQLRPKREVAQATCVGCQDGMKDEGRFEFDTYLPKVVHTAKQGP